MTEPSSRPFLSIGIPTWNRSRFLLRLLTTIAQQASEAGIAGALEVVVSDNDSTDDTRGVVEEFAGRSPVNIVYRENAENIGGTRNLLRALEASHGEFWMCFGDDDEPAPGALGRIVEELRDADTATAVYFDPTPGASAERLTIVQTAERIFYHLGNAGLFAGRGDAMRSQLESCGDEFLRTCWPQTELLFLAMVASGSPTPLTSVPLVSSVSVDHMDNTTYNTFYVVKAAVIDLYLAALDLRPYTGEDVYQAAVAHLFGWRRFNDFVRAVVLYGVYDDMPGDRRNTRRALWAALKEADGLARNRLLVFWAITAMPSRGALAFWWLLMALRHSPSVASAFVSDWKVGAEQRRLARERGSRAYGPGDL